MSCVPVIKIVYGIHKPRYVSDAGVVKQYNRLGLQDKIYRLKNYSEENRQTYRYIGNSMPDILLFNSAGQLTKFDIDCSNDFNSLVQLSLYDIDTMRLGEKSFQDFIDSTYLINSLHEDTSMLKMPMYVVKFAEYAGRLNKENVPHLVQKLSSRNDVSYIVLNMDYSVSK
jgi:hypothetical protein